MGLSRLEKQEDLKGRLVFVNHEESLCFKDIFQEKLEEL